MIKERFFYCGSGSLLSSEGLWVSDGEVVYARGLVGPLLGSKSGGH